MYPDRQSKAAEDLAAIRQMMEKAGGNIALSESWFCSCGLVWILMGFCQIAIGFLRNALWASTADLHILRQIMRISLGVDGLGALAVCLLYWQNRKKLRKTGIPTGLQIIDIWFAVLVIIPVLLFFFSRIISFGVYGNHMADPAAACPVIVAAAIFLTSSSLRDKNFLVFSILYLAAIFLAQIFPILFTADVEGVGQSIFCLSSTFITDVVPGIFLLLLGLRMKREKNNHV